jgi:hypothetical protein
MLVSIIYPLLVRFLSYKAINIPKAQNVPPPAKSATIFAGNVGPFYLVPKVLNIPYLNMFIIFILDIYSFIF